jgi:hypothetical protein
MTGLRRQKQSEMWKRRRVRHTLGSTAILGDPAVEMRDGQSAA